MTARGRWQALACLVAGILAWPAWPAAAVDGDYPTHAIRLVVTTPAGSGMDVAARMLAEALRETLGQPVVVDNRSGGDGLIAIRLVQAAAPDGYTWLVTSSGQMSIIPLLHDTPPYDAERDFVPVTIFARYPLALVSVPSLPVHSVGELAAYTRAQPQALEYGSASNVYRVGTEMFLHQSGARMRPIPYRGVPAVVNALLAGEVQVAIINVIAAAPLVASGKLRALAVTGDARDPALPGTPTFAQAGLSDYTFATWAGVFAPVGTPPALVQRMHAAIAEATGSAAMRGRFAAADITPVAIGRDAMKAVMAGDRVTYGPLAREVRADDVNAR